MHRNAPLTPEGRLRLCRRIEEGWPVAHAADSMGISRDRAYVWWRRYQEGGPAGLFDRRCRPHRSPNKTGASVERRIVALRRSRGLGPARIAGIVGMHASTVHRVLVRHGMSRLRDLDRTTKEPIRRINMTRPGELVHVDIKKLGRIPVGGAGASTAERSNGDAGTRPRSDMPSCIQPSMGSPGWPTQRYSTTNWARPRRRSGDGPRPSTPPMALTVERVITDNGSCYRSHDFARALEAATHTFTRPYRPQTNGKVERFNRTLLGEWAYVRAWNSDAQRTRRLAHWLHIYNHHRHHTAIGGPPISRVGNLSGHYS